MSLVVPVAMLLMDQLHCSLVQAIVKVGFIAFILFGAIVVIAGAIGMFNHEAFLPSACSGTDAATKIALKMLGAIGKGL